MEAIQTYYNGYHFRSRLEARWAVFFDALGVKYEYEPEGFNLNGTCYLPDFFLQEFDVYVEIKPDNQQMISKGDEMCSLFRDCTGRAIILCVDDPVNAEITLYCWDTTEDSGGSSEWTCDFVEFQNRIVLCTNPTRTDRDIYTRDFPEFEKSCDRVGTPAMFTGDKDLLWKRICSNMEELKGIAGNHARGIVNKAKLAARQARFEHGEKPKF